MLEATYQWYEVVGKDANLFNPPVVDPSVIARNAATKGIEWTKRTRE